MHDVISPRVELSHPRIFYFFSIFIKRGSAPRWSDRNQQLVMLSLLINTSSPWTNEKFPCNPCTLPRLITVLNAGPSCINNTSISIAAHVAFNLAWLNIFSKFWSHRDTYPNSAYPHYLNILQLHNAGVRWPSILKRSTEGDASIPFIKQDSHVYRWQLHHHFLYSMAHQYSTCNLGPTLLRVFIPLARFM